MGRPARLALSLVLLAGGSELAACGSTVTSVGSLGGEGGSDATTPLATDASGSADAASDAAPDAHPCPTSQCADVDGGVSCEGDHGRRLCAGGLHAEACTCGGTAPSHWIDCAGCP